MPPQSILEYLAPRWTNQLENVVTDGVAYLLSKYPDVFKAFREYVSLTGIQLPELLELETQATQVWDGRPDLAGADSKGDHVLIIESKFWATLTKKQPISYIGELPLTKPAILLFIAPQARLSELWEELEKRCDKRGTLRQAPPQFRTLAIDADQSKRILALTSWESLLAALLEQQAGDSPAAQDIRQLRSLCLRTTPPTDDRRILLDELIKRLLASNLVHTHGYKATPGPDYYRRYMGMSGLENWSVEYNEDYSRRFQTSRFLLIKYPAKQDPPGIQERLNSLPVTKYRYGQRVLFPLTIPDGVDTLDEALLHLQKQIMAIAAQLCP